MQAQIEMTIILCANCEIPFAITKDFERRLRECHNLFYCPKGHSQHFPAKSDNEKLADRIETLEKRELELKDKIKVLETHKRKRTKKVTA